jgi:hypothetical protein
VAYVVFVSRPTGYELREQDGDAPAAGATIELDGVQLQVTKVGPSPLPGDERACAYTLPA